MQYHCAWCGEGFEQRSRYLRHMASSHPVPAANAADLERALAGIDFPKSKQALVEYASQRAPAEIIRALEALPDRVYRDAAEVGLGFGAEKSAEVASRAARVAAGEAPARRGGRVAAVEAVSAAAVAKLLGGIDFPVARADLIEYARGNRGEIADPDAVITVLEQAPDRTYTSMADVEVEVGRIL